MGKDQNDNMMKQMKKMMAGNDMEEKFLSRREVFLWGEINDESAESIVKRILFFDGQNNEDITLFINSPGGIITAGLAIYDAMQYAKSDVVTV
ncbi:MAG: ATP-dependent Clp protease proteolytic subunit, partial [Fibrobacter sp.]|nr:ATP-dependent Clp protease proteolytic subunit [Fibrobacter sp.]